MRLVGNVIRGIASLFNGLAITMRNWLRPKTTIVYPFKRRELPPRYRGMLLLRRDPQTGQLKCTACGACERACPIGAIKIEAEGKGKERHPKQYTVDYGRCMSCRLCVEECPFDALAMTGEYEYAVYNRDGLVLGVKELAAEDRPPGLTITELRGEDEAAVPAGRSASPAAPKKPAEGAQ